MNPFINNENIPKTVFKYRDWTNVFHKKLLEGELYLSSPLDFNDPFDCNILVPYQELQNKPDLQLKYFTIVVDRQKPARRNLQPIHKCKLNIQLSQIQLLNIANCTTIGGMLSGN